MFVKWGIAGGQVWLAGPAAGVPRAGAAGCWWACGPGVPWPGPPALP